VKKKPRGRYAPSPTGELHVGNASTALVAWLSIRARGGAFVMRIEDLDRNRSRPELARQLLDDLAWLGLDWDEGPYEQWARRERYLVAFERLREAGRVYPCFCSRKEIAAAASAPQEPGDERQYAGTCRALDPREARRRVASGEQHAWRFRIDDDEIRPVFHDLAHGEWDGDRWPCGDFVVHRSDGVPAYQLAVVVDDAEMRIDEVVRGDDLLSSTRRQILLGETLGFERPVYGHAPLLLGADGVRLSKRHEGITLRELREGGIAPETLVGRLAHAVGLIEAPAPCTPRELIAGFRWSAVKQAKQGIVWTGAGS
jgi:glutamyl-tRNA synthetase